MDNLVVVNEPKDWPLDASGIEIVTARAYLTDAAYARRPRARVYNLCRSYRYQSTGYYVSLLASARGHKPIPSTTTILDLKQQAVVRVASDELEALIQRSLAPIRADDFVLSVYFGHNLAERHRALSQQIFALFPAPFLQARFVRSGPQRRWQLRHLAPVAASEIPESHRDFVLERARDYFANQRRPRRRARAARFDLALLQDPDAPLAPSNQKAIRRFAQAAERVGFSCELITRQDYGRLAEFDALFIRETTAVNHHTYRFARRATAEGLVVIDDPESILKCTNKVYLAELLELAGLPAPQTVVAHRGNRALVAEQLGLPCILKQPDSSFSQGVVKVETEAELADELGKLLEKSDLVIAQEYVPTEFDWRVGVLDGQPLFVSKYFMARHHWQIVRHNGDPRNCVVGSSESLPVAQAPRSVVQLALRATRLIGDGLYGVDIKQIGKRLLVIEVNDNPSVDAGDEDRALGAELYERVMRVLVARVESRKASGRTA